MTKRKIIIHPGVPKSGTTFMQDVLFDNHPEVLNIGRPHHKADAYQDVHRLLTEGEDVDAAAKAVDVFLDGQQKRANDEKIIVWSDETLLNAPLIYTVAEKLGRCSHEFEVLLTIRNQFDVIQSYYASHGRQLKNVAEPYNGKFVHFDEFFDFFFRSKKNYLARRYDYDQVVESYAQYLGKNNVHLFLFEDMVANREEFCDKLSEVLGVSSAPFKTSQAKEVNKGDTQKTVQYQNLRSKFLPGVSLTRFIPFGGKIREMFQSHLEGGGRAETNLSAQQKAQVVEYYAAGNAALEKARGIELAGRGYPVK